MNTTAVGVSHSGAEVIVISRFFLILTCLCFIAGCKPKVESTIPAPATSDSAGGAASSMQQATPLKASDLNPGMTPAQKEEVLRRKNASQ